MVAGGGSAIIPSVECCGLNPSNPSICDHYFGRGVFQPTNYNGGGWLQEVGQPLFQASSVVVRTQLLATIILAEGYFARQPGLRP